MPDVTATLLHSYRNALQSRPCLCRVAPFSEASLQTHGLRGYFGISSQRSCTPSGLSSHSGVSTCTSCFPVTSWTFCLATANDLDLQLPEETMLILPNSWIGFRLQNTSSTSTAWSFWGIVKVFFKFFTVMDQTCFLQAFWRGMEFLICHLHMSNTWSWFSSISRPTILSSWEETSFCLRRCARARSNFWLMKRAKCMEEITESGAHFDG